MPDGIDSLLGFLRDSPTPWHAAETVARLLRASGFRELDPAAPRWDASPGAGHFCLVGGSSLFAWIQPAAFQALRLGLAHTDSPGLRIKPNPAQVSAGCHRLGVEVYGGPLLHTWLDRELEIAGRVFVSQDGIRQSLVRLAQPRCVVPSLAIHLDRDVNDRGLRLDRQLHLPALAGLAESEHMLLLQGLLAAEAGVAPADIAGWDLCLVDAQPPSRAGLYGELLVSGRLDNLVSCHALLQALLAVDPAEGVAPFIALFDHEEVGSVSAEGAQSAFLAQLLERLTAEAGLDRPAHYALLARSAALSVDMAHALHPNRPEMHDPLHAPRMGEGPVIKSNASRRYATDGAGASHLRRLAAQQDLPIQDFVMRSDLACGSTVGPAVGAALGLRVTDVGAPMLAMHSARETMALADAGMLARLCHAFLRGD